VILSALWRPAAYGAALCALLALSAAGWYRHQANTANAALALSRADVAVLEAQRDSANALALDYQARADAARAAEAEAKDAAKKADAARARKWGRINESEKVWSEQPVPDAVVEGLR
jgi:hypothetical protein